MSHEAVSVYNRDGSLIEQRQQTDKPTCEWWHCGWFVCSADPLKGKVRVGAAFAMDIEEANIMALCLRRASDWLREAIPYYQSGRPILRCPHPGEIIDGICQVCKERSFTGGGIE